MNVFLVNDSLTSYHVKIPWSTWGKQYSETCKLNQTFPYHTFSFYWFDEGRATHCLSLNNVIIQQKLDVIHWWQDVDVL